MNSIALEGMRMDRAVDGLARSAMFSQLGDYLVEAAPTRNLKISATNLMPDPQGLGDGSNWAFANGTKVPIAGDVPARWLRYLQFTTTGSASNDIWQYSSPINGGSVWGYCFVRVVSGSWNIFLEDNGGAFQKFVNVPAGGGWRLIALSATGVPAGRQVRWRLHSGTITTGDVAHITGATVCNDFDPGEPFSGDQARTDKYFYGWLGGRNASSSARFGPYYNMVAVREREAGLDINPAGQTIAQRAQYLLLRRQARHHPYGQTFVDLITDLIQQDEPSFGSSGVRIVENFANYSFSVQIAYNPSGVLADRVQRLIKEVKPAHLALTGISWGTFQADVNKAGDPV
jgi:hypothetical protein